MQRLLTADHPEAEKVVLVTDNLNTQHGSWLDIAEIELSTAARQCLVSVHAMN